MRVAEKAVGACEEELTAEVADDDFGYDVRVWMLNDANEVLASDVLV